jgi:hypothetical protein
MHFCSDKCEEKKEQCDLCRAQFRKLVSDKAIKEGKPTLTYNPFARLGSSEQISKQGAEYLSGQPTPLKIMTPVLIDPVVSPYDLGWGHGYHDELNSCPYKENTPEHNEYWEGYEQGRQDC